MLLLQALDDRGFDDLCAGATIRTDGDVPGGAPGGGDDRWKGEATKDDGTAGGAKTQQTAPGDPATHGMFFSTRTNGSPLFHKRFSSRCDQSSIRFQDQEILWLPAQRHNVTDGHRATAVSHILVLRIDHDLFTVDGARVVMCDSAQIDDMLDRGRLCIGHERVTKRYHGHLLWTQGQMECVAHRKLLLQRWLQPYWHPTGSTQQEASL